MVIIPFLSMTGTSSQLTRIEVDEVAVAVTFVGGEAGAGDLKRKLCLLIK